MGAWLDSLSSGRERAFWLTVVALGFLLYMPIGRYSITLEGHILESGLDVATPFVPAAVWIYLLLYTTTAMPLVVGLDRQRFRGVSMAYLALQGASYVCFVLYPVHFSARPEPLGSGLSEWTMRQLYWVDQPSNCFPSLHVSIALTAGLTVWSVSRRIGALVLALAAAISISTMFVKQHWFADVASGAVLAWVAWAVFVRPIQAEARPIHRRGVIALLVVQVLLYGALALAWLLGAGT